jgi:hypothetical protein
VREHLLPSCAPIAAAIKSQKQRGGRSNELNEGARTLVAVEGRAVVDRLHGCAVDRTSQLPTSRILSAQLATSRVKQPYLCLAAVQNKTNRSSHQHNAAICSCAAAALDGCGTGECVVVILAQDAHHHHHE